MISMMSTRPLNTSALNPWRELLNSCLIFGIKPCVLTNTVARYAASTSGNLVAVEAAHMDLKTRSGTKDVVCPAFLLPDFFHLYVKVSAVYFKFEESG